MTEAYGVLPLLGFSCAIAVCIVKLTTEVSYPNKKRKNKIY